MDDRESKHDKVLKRVHLWVAILGGVITLLIGVYNFRNIFFPHREVPNKPSLEVRADSEPLSLESFLPQDRNGDGKVHESEWRGPRENFSLLDLDGNGVLNSQDFKAARFEDMDRNGDGAITRLEWRKARRSFDVLDADADGKISPDEYMARRKAASVVL